jgi:hypothetical protein
MLHATTWWEAAHVHHTTLLSIWWTSGLSSKSTWWALLELSGIGTSGTLTVTHWWTTHAIWRHDATTSLTTKIIHHLGVHHHRSLPVWKKKLTFAGVVEEIVAITFNLFQFFSNLF